MFNLINHVIWLPYGQFNRVYKEKACQEFWIAFAHRQIIFCKLWLLRHNNGPSHFWKYTGKKKTECDLLFYYILINIYWFPLVMQISQGLLQELQLLFMRKVIRALNLGNLLSVGFNRVSLKHTSSLLIGFSLKGFPLSHHSQILNLACSMTHSVAHESGTVLQHA